MKSARIVKSAPITFFCATTNAHNAHYMANIRVKVLRPNLNSINYSQHFRVFETFNNLCLCLLPPTFLIYTYFFYIDILYAYILGWNKTTSSYYMPCANMPPQIMQKVCWHFIGCASACIIYPMNTKFFFYELPFVYKSVRVRTYIQKKRTK